MTKVILNIKKAMKYLIINKTNKQTSFNMKKTILK
jgi:hypothetical protein